MIHEDIKIGDVFTNDDLIKRFAVGARGGIRYSTSYHLLVIVNDMVGDNPFKDKEKDGIIYYVGMGQEGDQSVGYKQNFRLASSRHNNLDLYYFEVIDKGRYTFKGQVELVDDPIINDPKLCRQKDINDKERWVVVFPLKIVTTPSRRWIE